MRALALVHNKQLVPFDVSMLRHGLTHFFVFHNIYKMGDEPIVAFDVLNLGHLFFRVALHETEIGTRGDQGCGSIFKDEAHVLDKTKTWYLSKGPVMHTDLFHPVTSQKYIDMITQLIAPTEQWTIEDSKPTT